MEIEFSGDGRPEGLNFGFKGISLGKWESGSILQSPWSERAYITLKGTLRQGPEGEVEKECAMPTRHRLTCLLSPGPQ